MGRQAGYGQVIRIDRAKSTGSRRRQWQSRKHRIEKYKKQKKRIKISRIALKYLVVLLLCGGVSWLCNASGIAVYAEDESVPKGAELIRFDLHKSSNLEVGVPAGIPGYFVYYYEGKEYHYGFRFDKNGTAAEAGRFGTAYVWAPYSVIYYDAAGGEIEDYGTATVGGKKLLASRGNGVVLKAEKNLGKSRRKFAADYTVYGQNLALSEGKMPTAKKKGYQFEGWYTWTDGGEIEEEGAENLAEREEYGTLWKKLNQRYTEQTKILENQECERFPASSITLYARWKKIWETD